MLSQIATSMLVSNVSTLLRSSREIAIGVTLSSSVRAICTSGYRRQNDEKWQSFIIKHQDDSMEHKKKEAYLEVLREYKSDNEARHGHVEFIKTALKYMDDFGVNRDLAVYKALLDILPKGKFVPVNYFQTIFDHFPEQQNVATELLGKMEHNCVIPDIEMQEMLLNIFGKHATPLKKFWRMMYWMPKFAHLNPWPCPRPAPKDPRVLAYLAMSKIASVDVCTKITEFKTKGIENSIEDTWIMSVMSRIQEELLQMQPTNVPIFVEGPYSVWVADQCIDYFVLRGSAREEDPYKDPDDVSDIRIPFWDKREIAPVQVVHEQRDGTYFAMCATGTSTKDSLLSWIRCLQKRNPILSVIPIMFKLASSTKEKLYIDSSENNNQVTRKQ